MDVQFTRAGKRRARRAKSSPTGEKQMHMWRFVTTDWIKKFQQLSRVSGMPAPLTLERMLLMT